MSNTNLLFVRASSATVGVAVSVQVYSTASSVPLYLSLLVYVS
jgi:hypothetical protein